MSDLWYAPLLLAGNVTGSLLLVLWDRRRAARR
jgi:ABC-type molybdate transport system permease subunit